MPGFDAYEQNVQYPRLGDTPNAETAFSTLTNGLVPLTNMVFANANARAATIPNPVAGMETWLISEGRKDVYWGNAWVPVARAFADAFVEDLTTQTTTSTTFNDSTAVLSTSIVIPPSGRVWVSARVTGRNSLTNGNTISSWRATGSAGNVIYGESSLAALIVAGTDNFSLSLRHRLTGLSAGDTMTVKLQHRVNTASTGTFDYRSLGLEPCAA